MNKNIGLCGILWLVLNFAWAQCPWKTVSPSAKPPASYGHTLAPKQISAKLGYDRVGNTIWALDGRGVKTTLAVNQLNQVVQVTRAADVSQVIETGLTAPAYQSRIYYDANNNVVKTEAEYRDGNNPNLPQYLEATTAYDILDKPITATRRINNTETATTQYRYDANQNLVEVLSPLAVAGSQLGNKANMLYDERDLLYQAIAAPSISLRIFTP